MKLFFFTVLSFALAANAVAQQTPPAGQQQPAGISEADETPVPVPEPSEKAMSYYKSGNMLWIVNQVWSLLIPALFLFTGFSAKIRSWAQRAGRKWFYTIGIYFIIFSALNYLIDLPLSYYQGFVREHAYGLSNQTIGKWWADSLKGLMVGMILGILFLWVVYLFLEKAPRRWWLYTGLATVPFLFFFMLIAPVWIDPLFNEFGSMKDKVLEGKILALAERAGIEGSRVYEVNKSVDTKAVNAYVTGFGNTKRIVLWDTILAKLHEEELLVVMGHEMGHYVLGHVIRGVLFFSAVIMLTLYAAHRLSRGLIERYKSRFGFDRLADIASLPLILLLVNILTLIVLPFMFGFTRYQEHEADRFGLEITHSNRAAAMAFAKLQEENLVNPRPGALYKLWRASHPTIADRIDFCNEYRPWKTGQPLKYGHLFKSSPPSEK